MQREVRDGEGTVWTCVQAYAGLSGDEEKGEAARAAGGDGGSVEVVCTPSGGAKSVRLELPGGWEDSVGDDQLVREIIARRET